MAVISTAMFPTGVGMKRELNGSSGHSNMFPTGVGMNRCFHPVNLSGINVPHRRGDEPSDKDMAVTIRSCSPQAWG